MARLKRPENQYIIWIDESMKEEMDETEVSWELYCQEMSFGHLFMT